MGEGAAITDIERVRALVKRGAVLFTGLTREEFVALTDMLAVVDQAAEASEAGAAPAAQARRRAAPSITG
jgi:hypothetical protein